MAEGKIFVCYRRDDSAGHAGRLYDRLNQRFPGGVFMDVTSIGVGTRWADVIDATLRQCRVAVILIGPHWLDPDRNGVRRLDNPDDPTRAEIAAALRLNLMLVPLLVSGATVPDRHSLPDDVAGLTDWQALRIDDEDFDHDTARLIRALEAQLGADGARVQPGDRGEQLGRLLRDAQSAIGREDWVTAAQMLRSALSLERDHAEAGRLLAFVQQQSRSAEQKGTPSRRSSVRLGLALGGLGLIGIVLAGTFVVALLVWMASMSGQQDPLLTPTGTSPDAPRSRGSSATPAQQSATGSSSGAPESAAPVDQRSTADPSDALQGDYMLAALSLQGVPQPWSGSLRLIRVNERTYQFEMMLTDPTRGAVFRYQGVSQASGHLWISTATVTNDLPVLNVAVPNEISFDGLTLAVRNPSGQVFEWRRQRTP